VVAACASAGQWSEALACWRKICFTTLVPDETTYSAVIPVLSKCGHWSEALGMLQLMRRAGIEIDDTSYRVLVSDCEKHCCWKPEGGQTCGACASVGCEKEPQAGAQLTAVSRKGHSKEVNRKSETVCVDEIVQQPSERSIITEPPHRFGTTAQSSGWQHRKGVEDCPNSSDTNAEATQSLCKSCKVVVDNHDDLALPRENGIKGVVKNTFLEFVPCLESPRQFNITRVHSAPRHL